MKKTGILIIALLLIAMLTGCRRNPDTTNSTNGSAAPSSTQTTARATTPSTAGNTKPSTGVIPGPSDVMPQPSDGTSMPSGNRGPRY